MERSGLHLDSHCLHMNGSWTAINRVRPNTSIVLQFLCTIWMGPQAECNVGFQKYYLLNLLASLKPVRLDEMSTGFLRSE